MGKREMDKREMKRRRGDGSLVDALEKNGRNLKRGRRELREVGPRESRFNRDKRFKRYDGNERNESSGRVGRGQRDLGKRKDGLFREEGDERVGVDEEFVDRASDDNVSYDEAGLNQSQDKGKAYDALLTLLKADQDIGSISEGVRANEEKRHDNGDTNDENDSDDEVAGAAFGTMANEEEDEEEDQLQLDDEDQDDGAEQDPFECHFNNISDDYIDSKTDSVGDKKSWKVVHLELRPEWGYHISETRFKHPLVTTQLSGEFPKVKQKIKTAYTTKFPDKHSEMEKHLLQSMFNYQDVQLPYKKYSNQLHKKFYAMHALNHVYKTRDRILKNNAKLHAYQESVKAGNSKGEAEPELRDQGFTRPKVLILLPTRNACYELVELLLKISGTDQQENKKKFNSQFFNKEMPPETKPEDFRQNFKGNSNDFFCIGVKMTRKSFKLYSSFYSSDIIIASPIGLSMILEAPDKKKRQYDFLSSIEVLIVDQCHQIEMQNWDHVNTVLKYVNKIPKESHDADFSRIRMWSINDQASLFRQNLVFSEFSTPSINNIVGTKSKNLAGKIRYKPIYTSKTCMMNSIGLKIKQIFHRFECASPVEEPDARFKFFINTVLPSLMRTTSYDDGLLIYIPSYFDYLRIKMHMKESSKVLFGSIDEYSSQSKLSRNRLNFASGKFKILLYTERLHHFRRLEIAGVKNVLMYGLPTNPIFYKELVRFVGKSIFKEVADIDLSFIKVMFSKWDVSTLERVIGTERAPLICNSVDEMYEFK